MNSRTPCPPQTCLLCPTVFIPVRAGVRYCSPACRKRAERLRAQENRKAEAEKRLILLQTRRDAPGRLQRGQYREPGQVRMHPCPPPENIGRLLRALFQEEEEGAAKGGVCGHRGQEVRQCARCRVRYCTLCVTVVHGKCEKGEQG